MSPPQMQHPAVAFRSLGLTCEVQGRAPTPDYNVSPLRAGESNNKQSLDQIWR